MSNRILTLFGEEEMQPEQLKAVGRSRAKKKEEDAPATEEPGPGEAPVAEELQKPTEAAGAEDILSEQKEKVFIAEMPQTVPEQKEKKTEKKFELPEDWKGDKKYYSIGEVATLFNVKTSHIRFWTNEFKLKVRTTRKGDRLYTPEQVRELKAIHHLVKERGFTLTGAKAKMKAQNNLDVETIDLKHALLQLRNKLLIIRNQLTTGGKKAEA